MCFSAPVSFGSAIVIGSVGLIIFSRKVSKKFIPLAMIPLIFSLQQAMEGIVWLSVDTPDNESMQKLGMYSFLSVATVFWPTWCPFAVYAMEPKVSRKRWLSVVWVIGAVVSLFALDGLMMHGAQMEVSCGHIAYRAISSFFRMLTEHAFLGSVALGAYTLATIGPMFISSVSLMRVLGVAISAGWLSAQFFYSMYFASVWCFFSAIASVLIYFVVTREKSK